MGDNSNDNDNDDQDDHDDDDVCVCHHHRCHHDGGHGGCWVTAVMVMMMVTKNTQSQTIHIDFIIDLHVPSITCS